MSEEDLCLDVTIRHRALLDELKALYGQALPDECIKIVVGHWDTIFGITNEEDVILLKTELKKNYEEFWEQQRLKLEETKEEYHKRIKKAGNEAVILEKALGLKPSVNKINNCNPLNAIDDELTLLLDKYRELKAERIEEIIRLQKKESELCSELELGPPEYLWDYQSYIPTAEDLEEIQDKISRLERQKEQLEYDFEDAKSQLQQLLDELEIYPLTLEERFAFGQDTLDVTQTNLNSMKASIKKFKNKKEEMMAEAEHLRQEIDRLSKKMFKDPGELQEFLATYNGFTERTINKLKQKLKEIKEERKLKLKDLIESSRLALVDWWDKCCYSDAQRKEFKAYSATRCTEEVLEFYDVEIEILENYYNRNKKIFSLAKQHEELWDRLLHLENQANNKERLLKNRGGFLLQEERDRKIIQKRLPAIKAELFKLLDEYRVNNGSEFLHFGEPLQQKIEAKEQEREESKYKERNLRKKANAENVKIESRLGACPNSGLKRKALNTPQHLHMNKTKKTEATTISSASSKSTLSSAGVPTLVTKEVERPVQPHLTIPTINYIMATPRRERRVPAASTPQNGSLSYESFQEHIERSQNLGFNSTRKTEQQRVLRPKNLNQTRTVVEKTTPYKTPKTPGKTFRKTPTKTPSRIPFRIATGSKIPSQVPPISPRKPAALSTTKLPIIF